MLQVSVNKIIYTAIYIKPCLCLFSDHETMTLPPQVNKRFFIIYTIEECGDKREVCVSGGGTKAWAHMLMTLDSFCTLLSSRSPFLMVSWYCQFLLSGLRGENTAIRGSRLLDARALLCFGLSLTLSLHMSQVHSNDKHSINMYRLKNKLECV